ncbi:MAG: hypothetical protein MJY62_05885 [Bacteroidales bacterium]|nr:hypothetical protein [Bacteroidales bacterium]
MKHIFCAFAAIVLSCGTLSAREYPVLKSSDSLLVSAFDLALRTVENNIEDGIVTAGGDYGGEWTRDASINAWNAGSLIFPEESSKSLWAVTVDGKKIGHQYWDKIIWAQGAYNHSLVTGEPIEPIYRCIAATMKELEDTVYMKNRGLFHGPSVFNDGIAGYEEPIPVPESRGASVLEHPNTYKICCLSTNCIYYWAYVRLASMAWDCCEPFAALGYKIKACRLRRHIRSTFYDRKNNTLGYLIDQNGEVHHFQEGLGYSFAILSSVVSRKEARALAGNVYISRYGIPSVYPHFKRFDDEHPGRHNNIIWPFVNAFWAEAALEAGYPEKFEFELRNLAFLAIEKGQGMFYEIYNPLTGEADGGWQRGHSWMSCHDQTWSATGYLRMVISGVFGIGFTKEGMTVNPAAAVSEDLACTAIENISYRGHKVSVSILPATEKAGIYVNGQKVRKALVPSEGDEDFAIEFYR